ncbi:MAG: SH3 domain-containing protein [Anaerolineae bacterium]|nr:SH3 domain-containing protein [Anaerolineae bacterium]
MSRKQVVVMGLVMCVVFALSIPVMAQTSTPIPPTDQPSTTQVQQATTGLFATANFRINVRSGPSTRYTKLGQLGIGDAVDITGRLADGTWLRINFNGQEGWVSEALVEVTGDVSTAPEAEAGATAILAQTANQANVNLLDEVIVVTRGNANLRVAPFTDADVLLVIPFNTQLTVIGRNVTSNWVQVSYNDQVGWISSGVVFFSQGNIDTVTMYDQAGNSVSPTEPPAPTDLPPTTATPQPTSAP